MTKPVTDAAFTWKGKPLPYSSLKFTFGSMTSTYSKALADPANQSAYIELERSRAPIMLISGQSDVVWPSSMLAGKVVERLKANKFRHEVLWKDYPNAGHILLAPNYKPVEKPPTQYGGTAEGVNRALSEAWPAMMEFLARANK